MPRPPRCRRVCALPEETEFGPRRAACRGGAVVMTVDEYEAIRLIDLLGCTQAECAAQMEVARSTAQAVYDAARTKLARALVEGRRLVIAGGDYALCPHAAGCAGRDCVRRGCGRRCGCGGCSQHKNGGK